MLKPLRSLARLERKVYSLGKGRLSMNRSVGPSPFLPTLSVRRALLAAVLGVGALACGHGSPGNTPPMVSVAAPAGVQHGVIALAYTLYDGESSPASIQVDFSTDGGSTFAPATASSGEGVAQLATAPGGVVHHFAWDSAQDGVGRPAPAQVQVRITPRDALSGVPAVSAAFTVVNTAKAYSLTLAGSSAVPVPAATGITSDQNHFWVVGGAQNSLTTTLACFDPDSQTVYRSFTLHNLIGQLGTGVYGLCWDGAALWLSVSGNNNQLVQVDPASGAVLRKLTSPTVLGPSDLDWDGSALWVGSGTGPVYTVDPVSGGSAKRFDSLGGRDSGIAVNGSEVWVADLFDGDLRIYDRQSGSLIVRLPGALPRSPQSLCFFQGQLVVLDGAGLSFYALVDLLR